MTEPLAFTIPEAVATSRVSRSEIYAALQRGDLEAKKRGRRTLILREELQRFMSSLPAYQAAA
ncbi:DNA-binding protein [Sphingomonas paeninsulae]|uniref:DNA-binding protein n=1 Tax=Sphingomonas paeninsulae TaxID=2319844 RepID=A0A494TBR6_SPHPE|nr:helix-turn-helix domain-containing protein [Sphingomonas paeninsulae]AYJ86889.1 DNA-binding protein [Sphingomonas paeninsulae]